LLRSFVEEGDSQGLVREDEHDRGEGEGEKGLVGKVKGREKDSNN